MIHTIIQTERRLSYEAKFVLRKAEAMKDPANVKWLVYVDLGLVKEVEDGEEFDVHKQDVQEFATEAEAKAFVATQTAPTTIEQVVAVPPDPYPQKPLAQEHAGQLHSMGERITDESNILYAAEWDGKAPWITVLKGSIADLKLAYMGWPMVDQATYEAEHPDASSAP